MQKWKEEYEKITVPSGMKEKVEEAAGRARAQKRRAQRRALRMWGSIAAALAIVLILPNTSSSVAAAMQQIPVLGSFFKVVTIREYQVDEDRYMADVKVPEVVPEDTGEGEEEFSQAQQSAAEINFDIQKVTNELLEEFKENMEEFEEGYQDLYINSEVLTDDDRWFSLELVLYEGAGSGYERHRHYTIDKTTGKRPTLQDFYGEDYVKRISDEVKEQMRSRMAEDENLMYWIDYEDMLEWNFEAIKEDQDFYVNTDGHVVICFDEYEVAPGYMGCVEFELSDKETK